MGKKILPTREKSFQDEMWVFNYENLYEVSNKWLGYIIIINLSTTNETEIPGAIAWDGVISFEWFILRQKCIYEEVREPDRLMD